ncbi:hypothetical protein ACGF5T_26740 [Streptomyces sp. NPDC047853]|uniref:hypothetical protein n=1 Tax=unclassified Streptomyces TaxID=2593676 RepID=UPI003457127E
MSSTHGEATFRFNAVGGSQEPISNLVMRDVDAVVTHVAESFGLRYTRYSDEMLLLQPSARPWRKHRPPVADVKKAFRPLDMKLNTNKTRVARAGARRSVLSVLVDGPPLA